MAVPAQSIERLIQIMNDLREKCPWDKKQTIHTLRSLTIEETYELGDAIMDNDYQALKKELGDLLLHIVFYSKIGEEQQQFTFGDVIEGICEKLIYRHPHVYGDVAVNDEEDVKKNWEQLKLKEGNKSVLGGVPKGLPALVKAQRIQEKAKQVGFEWETDDQVMDKIKEEMNELQVAIQSGDQEEIINETGDVLFSLVNYARFMGVDPETALERTNRKFIDRFQQMEKMALAEQKSLHDMSLAEMDQLWNQIKSKSK